MFKGSVPCAMKKVFYFFVLVVSSCSVMILLQNNLNKTTLTSETIQQPKDDLPGREGKYAKLIRCTMNV